nr:MAG TPA: D-ornithine aminomutase E component, D-ornithine-ornithine 4, 5 aminomutase (OAM) [Caudoviricetes sp.]
MKDLSVLEFSDLVYEKLESLKYKQILTNPTTTSKFPCLELHTPLKSVNLTENAFPIKSIFQISITCWNEKQRQAMKMADEVDEKLQELNFIRANTSPAVYDTILQKYGISITFEVIYNAIMNSFDFIR